MQYRIKSIKHTGNKGPAGVDRADGRYRTRIERVCEFDVDNITVGYSFTWLYITNAEGKPLTGVFKTSNVVAVEETEIGVVITTLNSVYEFEQVNTVKEA